MENLRPCPFCGGKAVIIEAKSGVCYNRNLPFRVKCGVCHCALAFQFFKTKEEAIKAWNRRADK